MTVVPFTGASIFIPPNPGIQLTTTLQTTFALPATAGDRMAMVGRVVHSARTGNKNINKVHFNLGAIVKAGGAVLKVSLQDVNLAAGPVIQPDGTLDQYFTVPNDGSYVSHAQITGTLTSDGSTPATRTVAHGDLLAVVWEWDSHGGSDTVIVKGFSLSSVQNCAGASGLQNACVLYTGGSWAATPVSMVASVLLEFDDGTFGTLDGGMPVYSTGTTTGSASINTGTTPDEYCLEFELPFATEVDGMWAWVNPAAGANFDMILYSGTTALATVSVDANAVSANAQRSIQVRFPKIALSADTTYRVAILPTTANNVTVYYYDLYAEAHMAVVPFGTTGQTNTRTDAGAWGTATETRRLMAGIRVSGIDIPASTGGGSYAFIG
jgi:hypothetical protein